MSHVPIRSPSSPSSSSLLLRPLQHVKRGTGSYLLCITGFTTTPLQPLHRSLALPAAMLPLDGDYVVFLLACATAGAISLLLLLQVYMLCFLKRAAVQGRRHLSNAATDAAEAPAGGGVDASTWAALLGASCVWAGDEEAAGDCVVCLSALQQGEEGGGGVRVLPRCRHAFHEWCIGRWLVSHSVCCPICRTPARPDPLDPAAAPEVVVTSPPFLPPPPLPPQPPLVAAVRGDAEAGGGFFSRREAMLLAEHQAVEELHLPLLLLY